MVLTAIKDWIVFTARTTLWAAALVLSVPLSFLIVNSFTAPVAIEAIVLIAVIVGTALLATRLLGNPIRVLVGSIRRDIGRYQ